MSFPSRFRGRCATCSGAIATGELIDYDRATRKASHAACGARKPAQDAPKLPREGRAPGEEPGAPPEGSAATWQPPGGRRRVVSQDEQWARTVEHGRADIVLCEHCGGSAAGRPMVHVACGGSGIGDEVPF